MTEHDRGINQSGILVPRHLEGEYFRTHGIEHRALPNGMTIFGMGRYAEDRAHARVQFDLASGAVNDPIGKEGLHHFMEHMVAKELAFKHHNLKKNFNAATSPDTVQFSIRDAVANPNYKSTGIWPVLRDMRDLFNNPFALLKDMDSDVETEKMIVSSEMDEHAYWQTYYEELFKILYAPDNPMRSNTIGTTMSMQMITRNDVYSVARPLFTPKGLTVSVLTEGPKANTGHVVDEITDLFKYYQGDQPPMAMDRSRLDHINPSLKPGDVYRRKIGFHYGTSQVNLFWQLPLDPYSVDDLSFVQMQNLLTRKLLEYSRREGLGYSSDTQDIKLEKIRLYSMTLNVPNPAAAFDYLTKTLIPDLSAKVIKGITDEDIKNQVEDVKTEQLAAPVSIEESFDATMDIYGKHKRILNLDQLKKNKAAITPDSVRRGLRRITDTKPVVVIFE